jgi:quercetin dioxygenase-like cupin family protein
LKCQSRCSDAAHDVFSNEEFMTKARPQAASKLLQETSRAIVTEWRFAPGAETGWHRHAHDYIVVVLTAGKLMQETFNGEIVTDLAAGQSYARDAGVEHNVVNPNPHEFVFVEVELK